MDAPDIVPMTGEARPKKSRPSRLGSIFRLNRKKYVKLKEDGLNQEF